MALSAPAADDRPVVAVHTTGIFCRDGCPAPAPRPGNAMRLPSAGMALFSGYRACLRCRPLAQTSLSDAEIRRAELLRPIISAARRTSRRRSGARAIVTTLIATPLGPMLTGATDDGICLAEFADRRMLPTQLETLRRRLGRPIVAGSHPHLDRLRTQLAEYFAGMRPAFDLPLVAPGSPFQQRTWAELRALEAGTVVSYEELAGRLGRPRAQRAVGTANGANRIAVVIPCHRVVRKSGEAGNYGGGRWRKEWLLAHEATIAATA
ncbi:MAG TPA: methylated-DNA--[protein]-cysteine S-methyltransferase [Methylomirabilota bacterium]|nr:methylated-DNA--[protein]-cysteine S-methyltransferase [Methylomirabilota bacterium]